MAIRTDRIARWAARQHGVVTFDQLRDAGASKDAVHHWAAQGRLHRVYRGVYAVGYLPRNQHARWQAAALAVPNACVSHTSAAELWRLSRRVSAPVHVTTTDWSTVSGIRIHHTTALPGRDHTWFDRIPVTSAERTLIDVAPMLSRRELTRAIREAEVRGLIVHREFAERVARLSGRRGVRVLREILGVGPAPTESVLEDDLLELILAADLPRPDVNARIVVGGEAYRADLLFADRRVIVEADGAFVHDTHQARVSDRRRQAAIEAAGYRVVRVTWQQVHDEPEQTVARIRAALADGPARR